MFLLFHQKKRIFVILLFYVLHSFCLLSYERIHCAYRVSSLIEVGEISSHEGRLLQELNSLHVCIFLWTLSFLSIIYRISRDQIVVLFWLYTCTNKVRSPTRTRFLHCSFILIIIWMDQFSCIQLTVHVYRDVVIHDLISFLSFHCEWRRKISSRNSSWYPASSFRIKREIWWLVQSYRTTSVVYKYCTIMNRDKSLTYIVTF